MSVVRLVVSDEQRRSQARGGDVDRGVDLSYNGSRPALPALSSVEGPALSATEGSPAEGPRQKADLFRMFTVGRI